MKELVFNRLKSYFELNPIIVILLLLGGVFSVILGAYAYGNIMPWPSAETPFKMHNRYFSLKPVDSATMKDAVELFELVSGRAKTYNFSVTLNLGHVNPPFTLENGSPVDLNYLLGERRFDLNERYSEYCLEEGAYMPLSTILDAKGEKVEPGYSFLLAGEETKFIGQMNTADIYLSEDYPIQEKLPVKSISFLTQRVLSSKEVQNLLDFAILPSSFNAMMTPLTFREVDKEGLPARFLMVGAILVLSIISYGFLIRYLVDLQEKSNAILLLLGFSTKRLRRFIVLEILLFSILSAAIGLVIYQPLYKYYLHERMLFELVKYHYYDYALITLIYVGIAVLTILPFAFFRTKNVNLEALWREG